MVVGDHQGQAQLLGVGGLLAVAHPAVHRDHQLDAALRQLGQRVGVQAIALFDAMGHIWLDLGAEGPQRLGEQRHGGHTVGVEIAPDGDGLLGVQRGANRRDHFIHALEGQRAGQGGLGGVQKGQDGFRGGMPPVPEELQDERRRGALAQRRLEGGERFRLDRLALFPFLGAGFQR